jgi:isoquinoline 1-oxidoreductase alpha subunit
VSFEVIDADQMNGFRFPTAQPRTSHPMPTLTINGARYILDCPPDTPLLWAIRERAGLTGTRPGCLVGLCGACTVHLDGVAARACSVAVSEAESREVSTIEAVLRTPLGRALELAWTDGGLQACEQCRPGRIMAAAALLSRRRSPSDEEVEAALGGHACDCREPGNVAEALRLVARAVVAEAATLRAERPAEPAVDPSISSAAAPIPERTNP